VSHSAVTAPTAWFVDCTACAARVCARHSVSLHRMLATCAGGHNPCCTGPPDLHDNPRTRASRRRDLVVDGRPVVQQAAVRATTQALRKPSG